MMTKLISFTLLFVLLSYCKRAQFAHHGNLENKEPEKISDEPEAIPGYLLDLSKLRWTADVNPKVLEGTAGAARWRPDQNAPMIRIYISVASTLSSPQGASYQEIAFGNVGDDGSFKVLFSHPASQFMISLYEDLDALARSDTRGAGFVVSTPEPFLPYNPNGPPSQLANQKTIDIPVVHESQASTLVPTPSEVSNVAPAPSSSAPVDNVLNGTPASPTNVAPVTKDCLKRGEDIRTLALGPDRYAEASGGGAEQDGAIPAGWRLATVAEAKALVVAGQLKFATDTFLTQGCAVTSAGHPFFAPGSEQCNYLAAGCFDPRQCTGPVTKAAGGGGDWAFMLIKIVDKRTDCMTL